VLLTQKSVVSVNPRVVGIVTTPIPFPMVQMSRTFIFFYIYTLPSALLTASSTPVADLVVLFIVTYGFIGLELISVELDDPFGDDVIDFDTQGSIHVSHHFNIESWTKIGTNAFHFSKFPFSGCLRGYILHF
jgi:predicted membrane chloride channel (bestrophin family)